MRALLLIGLVVLLAGCGAAGDTAPDDSPRSAASDAAPPTEPAPELDGHLPDGPPPAWLETAAGSFWLGYASYCWDKGCADFIGPSCDDPKHTPKITVRRGETVTAHLGFEPTELALTLPPAATRGPASPADADQKLRPTATPSWRVEQGGPVSLFARANVQGRSASYVACLILD